MTRDGGGRGPTLATGASGCYRYLDGITGLKRAETRAAISPEQHSNKHHPVFTANAIKAANTNHHHSHGLDLNNPNPRTTSKSQERAKVKVHMWLNHEPVVGIWKESRQERANREMSAGEVSVMVLPSSHFLSLLEPSATQESFTSQHNKMVPRCNNGGETSVI